MLDEEKKKDLKKIISVFLMVSLMTFLLFSFLWRNIKMSQIRYEIYRLSKKKEKLFFKMEKLRLQVSTTATANQIEELVRSEMGHLPVKVSEKITLVKLPEINSGVAEP